MEIKIFEERASLALSGKLPLLCSADCPASCCDPVITGSFIPKKLLESGSDCSEAVEAIRGKINEILEITTSDGKPCFNFEGVVISEIDTQEGFVSDQAIMELLEKRLGKLPPPEKLQEYIQKVRTKFRELNAGILIVFSCKNYDFSVKGCTSYQTRPSMCRSYQCEQLNPEKVNYSKSMLIQRMKVKKEQTEFLVKNGKKDLKEAVNHYLEKLSGKIDL